MFSPFWLRRDLLLQPLDWVVLLGLASVEVQKLLLLLFPGKLAAGAAVKPSPFSSLDVEGSVQGSCLEDTGSKPLLSRVPTVLLLALCEAQEAGGSGSETHTSPPSLSKLLCTRSLLTHCLF